jgi:hypothetical protein
LTTLLLLTTVSHHALAITSAPTPSAVILTHVASRLSFLDFDRFAQDFQGAGKRCLDCGFAIKCDKSESTRPASVFVNHQSGIHHTAELHEKLLKVLFIGLLADTANEDLASFLLFITRNGSLGVNLYAVLVKYHQ